jgi:hypothetical protein
MVGHCADADEAVGDVGAVLAVEDVVGAQFALLAGADQVTCRAGGAVVLAERQGDAAGEAIRQGCAAERAG